MIWGEDDIRRRVRIGVGAARSDGLVPNISWPEAEALLNEIDRLRAALEQVKTRAWANHLVRKIADGALR